MTNCKQHKTIDWTKQTPLYKWLCSYKNPIVKTILVPSEDSQNNAVNTVEPAVKFNERGDGVNTKQN